MPEQKNDKPAYLLDEATVYKLFNTARPGLEDAVAKSRLQQSGPNQLEAGKSTPLPLRYLRQFKDLMIVLLLISGLISMFLGDIRTGIVLFALVGFNTIIGFTQEYKAERIMESLVRLVVPEAKVMRNGKLEIVASTEIVLGDIVYIEEGDSVPADLRIVEESELSTNDFALTGESNPSRKFTHVISSVVPIGDRHNLTFMGTTVATGHGYGVAVGTGMNTELGRIANLSQDTSQDLSPLQREMNNIAKHVTQGTFVLCALLLPIAIQADLGIKEALLFAIGIASSIIPQGLPAEINTTLAQAAKKLAVARALVKKLSAVESLGATSIICTDKTGTLTKNQMTVQQFLIGSQVYSVTGVGYEANGNIVRGSTSHKEELSDTELKELELFFVAGVFASNAHVDEPDDEHADWYAIGDPTEAALITLSRKARLDPLQLDSSYPELKEFAFDSARKRMSSVRAWGEGKRNYVFVKGAPERVLQKCTDVWDHGHTRPIEQNTIADILHENERLAQTALRNLGYAYKVLPAGTNLESLTMEDAEENLTYLGMVSMLDPLREEVPEAMQQAHDAQISVSIITGDYASTAQAIAIKAGLAENAHDIRVVVGEEVQKLSDKQILDITLSGSTIFSRVSPEDKLRIVGLIKDSGRVVAVTGDGINDAPALKRADIGVAMGVTGTDVAKQSADIVLLDDSFHTLISAVQQGRIVFQNIKKGTLSCFTSNSAELVVNLVSLAAASIFGVPLALTVMQILAIDLIAELFPIAALGWDKADRELMHEPARDPHHHILNYRSIIDLLWCGLLIGGFAFSNYLIFFLRNGVSAESVQNGSVLHMQATALTYLTIVLCQLGNILQRRSQDGLFTRYQLHNKHLWFAILLSLVCVLIILYSPINQYFGAGPLDLADWLFAIGAAILFLSIREVQRLINKHGNPNHTTVKNSDSVPVTI
jgi:Ca2+-transporting ATPase